MDSKKLQLNKSNESVKSHQLKEYLKQWSIIVELRSQNRDQSSSARLKTVEGYLSLNQPE